MVLGEMDDESGVGWLLMGEGTGMRVMDLGLAWSS